MNTPENCKRVNVVINKTMRFKHYKKNSQQYRDGIIGRWQEINDACFWQNCQAPDSWEEIEVDDNVQG